MTVARTGSVPANLLRAIVDAAENGLILLDGRGRVVLWNDWIARASGVGSYRALGATMPQIFPEIEGSRVCRAMVEAVECGMSALLSSSLNKKLLPLFKEFRNGQPHDPMQQIVVIKPLTAPGEQRYCLVQVSDISSAAARETILRQQARTMQALAENYRLSELHIRAIVDSTADAIVTFDAGGVIGTYNPAAQTIFGYEPQEIVGKTVGVLMPELGGGRSGGTAADAAETFIGGRREITGLRRNGSFFPLELSVSAMELGGQRLFIGIAHDITARKQADEELKNQKEWLTSLIDAMPDIVCFKDGEGRWLVANQNYLDLYDLGAVDYQGKTAGELSERSRMHSETLLHTFGTDQQAWVDGVAISYEHLVTMADGTDKVFDMLKVPLHHQDGSRKGLVVVGRDVTDRKQAAERIQHMAHHDSLTGLPNRVLFQDRLRAALAQAKRSSTIMGLMFLDLDKFKDVNDTLGHHIGDQLLKAVAKRLKKCVRETDTVARLGGDEFAVLLTNLADAVGASTVAESIISSIAEPFGLEDNEIVTSTSIGITIFPFDAQDADQLLKNADLAMFRSKAEGRNNYHFYVSEMDAEVQARKVIERDLRTAMGTDQLAMYYQPLVSTKTGTITGCEALLRWRHPERGFISPAEFIPIAEKTDLIFPLGRWVLHRACVQAEKWAREGLRLRIAINLSAAQFKHQDLVATICDVLYQTKVDPRLLQLEITESIAMHNVDATIEVLSELRRLGIEISIDDFGTGYSSLNYLKRFPVDKLKIDRSFVTDIGLHPDNAAIVKAIINLGHGIGTKVNVEGVETQDQLDFLVAHGVDEVQGFLVSKALDDESFAALVRSGPVLPMRQAAIN